SPRQIFMRRALTLHGVRGFAACSRVSNLFTLCPPFPVRFLLAQHDSFVVACKLQKLPLQGRSATMSRARGPEILIPYQLAWPRWHAYACTADGWTHPLLGTAREVYDPTGETALAAELARVATADTTHVATALQTFYRQFGLLGQTALQGERRILLTDPRHPGNRPEP